MPRRVFYCATAWRGRVRRVSRFAKKQENTEEITARQFQKGRAQLSRARCKCAPPCHGAHLSAGGCERYSAIVRTTLEVGRVSPGAPPFALTALRICSS